MSTSAASPDLKSSPSRGCSLSDPSHVGNAQVTQLCRDAFLFARLARKQRSLSRFVFGLVAFTWASLTLDAVAREDQPAIPAPVASIEAEELEKHIQFLADDSLEGREAGSRGGRAAGNFLIEACQGLGLKPAGEGEGFVQGFNAGYRNILAVIEGSDPKLKDEYIVLGAHYDHVGYGNASNSFGPVGRIHNGADDNASGTSALLEIAEAIVMSEHRPPRSILIAFWDGEELGLLGSKHWLRRPTVPLAKIRLMINIDMIGRLRPQGLEVYGTRTAVGLRKLVCESNEGELRLKFNWDLKEDSDHYPFAQNRVPVLMYHTGLHDQYHRPSDDPHTINEEGLEAVTRLTLTTVWRAAQADQFGSFRSDAWRDSEFARKRFEAIPARVNVDRLGVGLSVPQDDPSPAIDEEGYRVGLLIGGTRRDSPAFQAGIRAGERIVSINGTPLESEDDFRRLLVSAPQETKLRIMNTEGEVNEVTCTLEGSPARVGLSWIPDTADPGIMYVTHVVPHSPAALAGFRLGDRIYQVNDEDFQGSKGLLGLFQTATGTTTCLLEREGKLQVATLELDQ